MFYIHGKRYGFRQLDPEHQAEILGHLDLDEAEAAVWLFREYYPTYEAEWYVDQAADVDLERVGQVVRALEAGGEIRPILIAEIPGAGEEESSFWVEGAHRVKAASFLGWEFVPVLYRVV